MTSKQKKEVQELFKLNRTDKLWMTEDGIYFLNENSAKNRALREHGKMREKALKVTAFTAGDLSDEKQETTEDPTKKNADADLKPETTEEPTEKNADADLKPETKSKKNLNPVKKQQ